MGEIARKTQQSLSVVTGSTGLLLDKSGWEKARQQRVGVAREYIGNVGKVINAQVSVFAALCRGDTAGLVNNARLYLPAAWSEARKRCQAAGIPAQ